MPHRGFEPASAACRSDALPTELHPHPLCSLAFQSLLKETAAPMNKLSLSSHTRCWSLGGRGRVWTLEVWHVRVVRLLMYPLCADVGGCERCCCVSPRIWVLVIASTSGQTIRIVGYSLAGRSAVPERIPVKRLLEFS